MARFPTVDADGHVEENHIDWKERLPARYKSQAPERRPSGNGQLRTIIEGKAWPRPKYYTVNHFDVFNICCY